MMDIYIYIHWTSGALKVPLEVYLVKKKRPERAILKFRHGSNEWSWMDGGLDNRMSQLWVTTCRVWFRLWCVMWILLNFFFGCCNYQSSLTKKVDSVGEQWYLQAFWNSSQTQLLFRNLPSTHGFCAAIGSESACSQRGMPGPVGERGAATLYAWLRSPGHEGPVRSPPGSGSSTDDERLCFAVVERLAWKARLHIIWSWILHQSATWIFHTSNGSLEHGKRGKRFA